MRRNMADKKNKKDKKKRYPSYALKPRTSIEVDSGCAKAVEMCLKKDGAVVISNIAVAALDYFSNAEIPGILRAFLHNNKFKAKTVTTCFPRSLSTIRFMELPSTDPAELSEMVSFQAIKQIPYSPEDMAVDFEIVDLNEAGYSTAMMVIAHKNVIYQTIDTLEDAGVYPERVDVNSQAILRAYFHLDTKKEEEQAPASEPQTATGKKSAVALVDIDYTNTTIQIICGKQLVFSRGITLGILHLVLKEKKFQAESANINWQSELIEELRRSFAVFSREHENYYIEKIVLSGGVSNFHNIDRNVRSRFQVPVETFNIITKIPALANLKEKLTINGKEVSLMAPIGLIIPAREKQIDMIPQDIKDKRKQRLRSAQFAVAGVLLAALLLSGTYAFYAEMARKTKMIGYLETQINQIAPKVKDLELKRSKVNVIDEQVGGDRSSLDFLRELFRVVPEKIYLTAFLYDESKYIVLKGTAHTMSDVFELIPELENSPYFEKVSSRGVKRRQLGSKEIVDFEIQCSLIKTEDSL